MDSIDEQDRQRLLALARTALEARVLRRALPAPEAGGALEWPCGAFVTIHSRGLLRGCLGRIETQAPLSETVLQLGASVADSDPRFDPVTANELRDIDIEISVLAPEREVASIADVEPGRHGVIIEQGFRRGLLLPQVAVEQAWDAETLVSHTCRKAGLPPDAWRHGARIFVFEAQVFGERALP